MSLSAIFGRAGAVNVVLVQTKTGGTIKGALIDRTRDALVLRAASVLSLGVNNAEEWTKATGDVVIPMANVDYWQEALPVTVLD